MNTERGRWYKPDWKLPEPRQHVRVITTSGDERTGTFMGSNAWELGGDEDYPNSYILCWRLNETRP